MPSWKEVRRVAVVLALGAGGLIGHVWATSDSGPSFAISFNPSLSPDAVDGRILLVLSTDPSGEPRAQITHDLSSQIVFGMNVLGMKPGEPSIVTAATARGWPILSLRDVQAGDYYVQAVLNRYETFHRADGSVVQLHPDRGEGQHWNVAPGNLFSTPMKLHLDPSRAQRFVVSLDHVIAPIPPKSDTEFVKHISIKSELLSRFWGRPIFIGAVVLLPAGFSTHPGSRYPLMVFHNHFPEDVWGFRTAPPDPNLKPDYSKRFQLAGYNRIQQQEAYRVYQKWVSADFPRLLVVEISHANPYYDDSYAVNSANLGPYGDAINNELIPYIEAKFRAIGQGWARFTYGGSTGGWEAMATQVFYPDMYNGAFIACPDPIDFHAYTNIDLYNDSNAYVEVGVHESVEQPAIRDYLGRTAATQRQTNYYELALGDHGRSGEQYDIWQAVFGPQGSDGYPAPIFDKISGVIDHKVAAYWRENYDLTHILQREWPTLGPKLKGKLHFYVGSADTYFLNDAVYAAQRVIGELTNPRADAEFSYGERQEHCWNGDPSRSNAYTRLDYNIRYVKKILERIQQTAPPGADLSSWRY
jgi:hypothetical protein